MTERETHPGQAHTGAPQDAGSGSVDGNTGTRCSPAPFSGGRWANTNDMLAELDAIFAQGKRNGQANATNGQATTPEPESRDAPADDSGEEDDPFAEGEPQRLEDALIGERIARDHLEDFRHASGFGWMKFDGRRWERVEETIVCEVVRQALIEFHRSEAQSGAELSRLQHISRMLSTSKIKAITYITKLCRTTQETFDGHPDLLNVRNGVVDLRDGTLRPHDPDLMFTKVTMVDYVPDATHWDWEQALAALPADAKDWLQIRMGQGLTGHPVPDDRLVVLKGSGSNGKTTIIDGVREAVGPDYAVTLPDRVLLSRSTDHPTELMTLRGARLGLMEEFPELGHLNVKRLKDLLGTGEITARYIAKDSVTWKPSHTIFVTTNYLPRVDESDDGTWRRLLLVDFPYRYRQAHETMQTQFDRVGDPNLRERLRRGGDGQHEAVLAWLIAGAVKWYRNRQLMPEAPKSVSEATQAWRRTSDLLMRYMDDRLVFDNQSHVMATELFDDFTQWLTDNGHVGWSDQNFSARLTQHGEAIANGLEKKRGIRKSTPGLSRRPEGAMRAATVVPPKTYTAWLGLRFRTHDDENGKP
jgi:P4 family phage/plasmid primase-like protien